MNMRFSQKLIVGILVFALVGGVFAVPGAREVRAQGVGDILTSCFSQMVGGSFSSFDASVPVNEGGIRWKECSDGIAKAIARQILQQLVNSVINWANSGFQGSPTFISNPQRFWENTANEITGIIIEEAGLSDLCTPFKPQLIIALTKVQPYQSRLRCTLLDVVDNIEGFAQDFRQGGWEAWIETHTNDQNNPFGAYILTSDELQRQYQRKEQQKRDELIQGNGYISLYQCAEADQNPDNWDDTGYNGPHFDGGIPGCVRAEKTTPGGAIASSVNFSLNAFGQELIAADEINEAVGLLLDALVSNLIQSGLSSLTDSGGGGTWYSPSQSLLEIYNAWLPLQIRFQTALNSIVAEINTLSAILSNAEACYVEIDTGAFPQYTAKIQSIRDRLQVINGGGGVFGTDTCSLSCYSAENSRAIQTLQNIRQGISELQARGSTGITIYNPPTDSAVSAAEGYLQQFQSETAAWQADYNTCDAMRNPVLP